MNRNMNYEIRLATLEDLPALWGMEQHCFDERIYHRTSRRQYRYLLQHGNADILIACTHKQVIGAAVIFYRKNSKAGRLYSIAVLPEYQGGEIGKALFEAYEKRLIEKNLALALLEIRADNHKHKERYLAQGYQLIKTLPDYYPDGSSALKLRKKLSAP